MDSLGGENPFGHSIRQRGRAHRRRIFADRCCAKLCQLNFETFAEGKGRSFEGLEGDGDIGGIEKPV